MLVVLWTSSLCFCLHLHVYEYTTSGGALHYTHFSVIQFVIGYFLPSFLFYWSDLECILFVLFWYVLVSSLWAFLSFCALVFVGFLLPHKDTVFTLSRFVPTACVIHRTLHLILGLMGIHSATAAASMWATFVSASHLTRPRYFYCGGFREREFRHELRLKPCWMYADHRLT